MFGPKIGKNDVRFGVAEKKNDKFNGVFNHGVVFRMSKISQFN